MRIFQHYFILAFFALSFSACNDFTAVKTVPAEDNEVTTGGNGPNQGVLDPTIAFPGSGNYSGYDAAALPASQVCSTTSIFGVTGTAACIAGSATDPAVAGNALSGKQFWDSTGTLRTGTITSTTLTVSSISHATDTSRTVSAPAATLYTQVTLDLGAEFLASNFCTGKTIFGRVGNVICGTPGSDAIDLLASSHMHRDSGTDQHVMAEESGTLNLGYRLIPDPSRDDDGNTGSSVSKLSRPTRICGKDFASVEDRIADCAIQNPTASTWFGNKGVAGEADWKLVTVFDSGNNGDLVTASAREIWRDERTRLLWSDVVEETNWCRASGNVANSGGVDCTPGGIGQPASPISYCTEAGGLTTPGTEDNDKGGMRWTASGTSPSVFWRLPSKADWLQADLDGIRHVLPRMEDPRNGVGTCDGSSVYCNFWTTTTLSYIQGLALIFDGKDGSSRANSRLDNSNTFIRCVGMPAP